MNLIFITAGLGSIVVLILGAYAIYLYLQLRAKAAEGKQAIEQLNTQLQAKDAEARQSVQIIARALLQKDLSETEAAMRIAYLSQQVIASDDETEQFSVFRQLAEATSHIPILEDWQMLEKSEKRRLSAERVTIEATYAEFMEASAEKLVNIKQG